MASLVSLPYELIGLILLDLSSSDKNSLCLACRSLNLATVPALYENIELEWDPHRHYTGSDWTPVVPRIEALLRTLVQQPKLAATVKCLEFRADWEETELWPQDYVKFNNAMYTIELSRADQDVFRTAIEKFHLRGADNWMTALSQKDNLYVLVTLVIGVCERLETLIISNKLNARNSWFDLLIENSLRPATHDTGLLGSLTQVHMTGYGIQNVWIQQHVLLQLRLSSSFYIPLVEILGVSSLYDGRRRKAHLSSSGDYSPFIWPLGHAPAISNLTILRILHSSIHPKTLTAILKQTPNVHTFEFSVLEPIEMEANDITAIRQSLYPIRNTLRDLTVRYAVIADEHDDIYPACSAGAIDGCLGPLDDFPVLTSLTVSLAILCGYHGIEHGNNPQLADFLAPTLQKLTITDDLWGFSDYQQCFENIEAMRMFRRFLSGDVVEGGWPGGWDYDKAMWVPSGEVPGWKIATPALKEFVYDHREEILQSGGYWAKRKYRNQLKRVARAQGIECKVLYKQED